MEQRWLCLCRLKHLMVRKILMEGISPTRLHKDRLPHLFPFCGLLSRYKASMDVELSSTP